MRKVKFTQASFEERLDQILTEFPVMDVSSDGTRFAETEPSADMNPLASCRTSTLSSRPS
jgi:hypothetical protein